ncbi:MAG: hypothetical protein LCH53_13730 [Bacteroidetes bacterium]|nr:hypothetical protein [Bacteroidota bacterium]
MCRVLSSALLAVLDTRRFTAAELADVAGVSSSTFSRWCSDEAEPRTSALLALQRYTAERGEMRLVRLSVPPTLDLCVAGEARSNGTLDDEAADVAVALGRLVAAHRSGDGGAMDEALSDLDRARDSIRAERQRL